MASYKIQGVWIIKKKIQAKIYVSQQKFSNVASDLLAAQPTANHKPFKKA